MRLETHLPPLLLELLCLLLLLLLLRLQTIFWSDVSSSVKGKGKERETGIRIGKGNLSDLSASKESDTQGVEGKEEEEA